MILRPSSVRSGKRLRFLAALFLLALSVSPLAMPLTRANAASAFAGAQAQPRQTSAAGIPDNPVGVNVFLQKDVEIWKIEQTLRMIAAANIQWIKQEFPWDEIEFKKNYFTDDKWNKSSWEKFDTIVNLAVKYNLKIIARVDHPPAWAKSTGTTSPLNSNSDLSDFTNALLDHYKGKISYVQIWNEPNLAAEWIPDHAVVPAQYAAMLKAVYPAVKQAHPDTMILSAPLAMTLEGPESRGNMNELDYWTGLYAAGVKGNFDIASANGYGLDEPPEAAPAANKINFRRVELLHDIMVQNGDSKVPVWFSEYGWNASPDTLSETERNYWRHVTLQQQAEWSAAGFDYARQHWPWAGVISIWYFRQVGDIPPDKAEYYFQMVDPAFVRQPVYDSMKVLASHFPGPANNPLPAVENPPPTPTAGAAVPPSSPSPEATPAGEATSVATAPATAQATLAATAQVTPQATPQGSTTAQPEPSSPPANTNNSSPLIMYVIGGVLVLGGLAGIGYYFTRGRAS